MGNRTASWVVIALVVGTMAVTRFALSQEKPSATAPHPALVTLKAEFERILKESAPEAKVAFDGESLVVEYRLRKYLVHGGGEGKLPIWEFSEEAYETTGPSGTGIMLKAHVGPGREYLGQRVVPQTTRKPYWNTYLNAYPVKDKNEHLWIELSSGLCANENLIEALKAAAASVER
jgi:hypothetical protein